jgi:hypothetical protein
MKIDQAIFGLGSGGHSLLQCSGSREVFKEIERRMDLPNTAPHGIAWSPYLGGFSWREYLVLSKTELDTRATRGGVVFTRALLLPIEEIIRVQNIEPFIRYLLETGIDETGKISAVEIIRTETDETSQPASLVAITNALSSRDAGPAVWVGLDGFDQAITGLWKILWPELRRSLTFRLSFGPDDLIEKPTPNLVVTPQGLAAKWANSKVINRSPAELQPSQVTTALLDPEAARRLRQLAEDYGLRVNGFQDVFLAQQLHRATERDDFTSQLSSLRIIESLSESSEVGRGAKAELLRKILAQVPEIDAPQVLPLRNLQITKVDQVEALWRELANWLAASHFPQQHDIAFLEIIRDALTGSASIEPWSRAMKNGFIEAARQPSNYFSVAAWRWVNAKPSVGNALFSILPEDSEIENRLIRTIPATLSEPAGLAVLSVCIQKRWLRLHGAVSYRTFDVREAIKRQLSVDTDVRYSEGLMLAIGQSPDREVIEAAIINNDDRLIDIASERVSVNPSTLSGSDFALYPVQRIWTGAILKSRDSWKAPHEPREAAAIVFDNRLIEGHNYFTPIVDAIAQTPLADVSGYPRRPLLWGKLGSAQRQAFLQATATGFIDQLATFQTLNAPEPVLETAILESGHTYETLVAFIQTQPNFLSTIASVFPSFNQKHFERLLDRLVKSVPSIPMSVSQSLGAWLRHNNWRGPADWMLNRVLHGRSDLRPALTQCAELFAWFTRFRYQLSSVSNDQKWVALREVASTLYPSGPDHHDIWERSGGKNRELEHHGDGESRWTAALNRMRNGNGVHTGRLLHEMRQEYPMNEELRFLAEDVEFGGWRK